MFLLKKVVSFWLMPLPLSLGLLLVGLGLLVTRNRQRLGRGLIVAATGLLLLASNRAVSIWMIRPLEMTYPPTPEFVAGAMVPSDLAACRAVVVLGGGNGDAPDLAAANRLSTAAQARLLEAIRLLRVLPSDVQLVVCGRGRPDQPSHAEVLAAAAISLGVPAERIRRLDSPRDTADEATRLRDTLHDSRFALVTSAWHLPRAMALMRRAGLDPHPCPADYTDKSAGSLRWQDLGWDTDALGRTTRALHERLGSLWLRIREKSAVALLPN